MPYIRYRTFRLYPGFKHSLNPSDCKPYCTITVRKHRYKQLRNNSLVMLTNGPRQGAVHNIPLFCNDGMYNRRPYCRLILGAETLKSLKNKDITLND